MHARRTAPVATLGRVLRWMVAVSIVGNIPSCGARTSLHERTESLKISAGGTDEGSDQELGSGGIGATEVLVSSAEPSDGGSASVRDTTTYGSATTRPDPAPGTGGVNGTGGIKGTGGAAFTGGTTHHVSAVVMGYSHTCSLIDGAVYCWGRSDEGQLGIGSRTDASMPTRVGLFSGGVTALAAAGNHTCALLNQRVYCWGQNRFGELGNGTTDSSDIPVAVDRLHDVNALSAGVRASCAAGANSAYCWGAFFIETDDRTTSSSLVPIEILHLPGRASSLVSGATHTCILIDGGVRCWGRNRDGQLGDGTTQNSSAGVPVVGLESGVTAIAAGVSHSCAAVNGSARCWGLNSNGQLGNGSTESSAIPVQVRGLTAGVTALDASAISTCGVRDGTMWCWGGNGHGQLGNRTTVSSSIPVQVQGLNGPVTAIGTSGEHTCAVLRSRWIYCWGANDFGQLGDGTTTNSLVPVLSGPF